MDLHYQREKKNVAQVKKIKNNLLFASPFVQVIHYDFHRHTESRAPF